MDNPNELRHQCAATGCWLDKHHVRIEAFSAVLPRDINCSDIDSFVEINGRFLLQEWKHRWRDPLMQKGQKGQLIAFQQLTRLSGRVTFILVEGVPGRMEVNRIAVIRRGIIGDWINCTFIDLRDRVQAWAEKCDGAHQYGA